MLELEKEVYLDATTLPQKVGTLQTEMMKFPPLHSIQTEWWIPSASPQICQKNGFSVSPSVALDCLSEVDYRMLKRSFAFVYSKTSICKMEVIPQMVLKNADLPWKISN